MLGKLSRKLLNENVKPLTVITAKVGRCRKFENYEGFVARSTNLSIPFIQTSVRLCSP